MPLNTPINTKISRNNGAVFNHLSRYFPINRPTNMLNLSRNSNLRK